MSSEKLLKSTVRKDAVHFVQDRHGCSERRACLVLSVNRVLSGALSRATRIGLFVCVCVNSQKKNLGAELSVCMSFCAEKGLSSIISTQNESTGRNSFRFAISEKRRKSAELVWFFISPNRPNQKWELDFVSDQLLNGRRFKVLIIVDLWDRTSPALVVYVSLTGNRVVAVLERLRGQGHLPRLLHVDNGPEFTCKALDAWAYAHGVRIEFSRPGKQTDKIHIESFNGCLRDECLNTNLFSSIADARRQVEVWRLEYNNVRPHSSLG